MPTVPHVEKHFTSTPTIRDIVIGMSDGLTVPFALAAGLSGAVAKTSVVVTAGLAEVAAGSIAMGLGGYLAAKTDAEHYASERRREVERDRADARTGRGRSGRRVPRIWSAGGACWPGGGGHSFGLVSLGPTSLECGSELGLEAPPIRSRPCRHMRSRSPFRIFPAV